MVVVRERDVDMTLTVLELRRRSPGRIGRERVVLAVDVDMPVTAVRLVRLLAHERGVHLPTANLDEHGHGAVRVDLEAPELDLVHHVGLAHAVCGRDAGDDEGRQGCGESESLAHRSSLWCPDGAPRAVSVHTL